MARTRVLAVLLEGFDAELERSMRDAGQLPNIAKVRERSARFDLDHGLDHHMGLFGEQIAAGLSPEDGDRYSVVAFDPEHYDAAQEGALLTPFTDEVGGEVVVFDIPYFDLSRTTHTKGLLNWGPHDPGGPVMSRPDDVLPEFLERFGPYPGEPYVWGVTWNSVDETEKAVKLLVESVNIRAAGARWLLEEKLPDWDLALLSVTEPHSGVEQLWHGIDTNHRLHSMPSAPVAGEGMREIMRATDRMVGLLAETFPDATLVLFSMHGMGSNYSDVQSMILFPEFMARAMAGREVFHTPEEWASHPGEMPVLRPDQRWLPTMKSIFEGTYGKAPAPKPLGERLKRKIDRRLGRLNRVSGANFDEYARNLTWHPTYQYRELWPTMRAFPVPSFDDGRIRVNLIGREAHGLVPVEDYDKTLDEVEALARACVDPITGRSVVRGVTRPVRERGEDPLRVGPSEYDMAIEWNDTNAFQHPDLGLVGPIPYRRSGGHTGLLGEAYICGPGIEPTDRGLHSSYDVVPTFFELLGRPRPSRLSGKSLFEG